MPVNKEETPNDIENTHQKKSLYLVPFLHHSRILREN